MSKNENTSPTPDLSPYIDVISQRFRPTERSSDATHRFSTEEILNAIRELNPGIEVRKEHVFDAMHRAGYYFDSAPGMMSLKFQWLLVEK